MRKVQKLPAGPSSSELSAHQMAPPRTPAAYEPVTGRFSSRPMASSLYSLGDGGSVPRRPCWNASFFRAFPLFLGLPNYGVFSAACFGLRRFLRIPGIGSTATMVLPATQFLSNLQLCLLQCDGFLCWSLWESVICRVSCVHLPVWLMSQDFPEVESPAGFAALEGSARFQGPAHQGFSGFRCLSGLQDQHTEGAVPRTGRATLKDHYCGRVTRTDS